MLQTQLLWLPPFTTTEAAGLAHGVNCCSLRAPWEQCASIVRMSLTAAIHCPLLKLMASCLLSLACVHVQLMTDPIMTSRITRLHQVMYVLAAPLLPQVRLAVGATSSASA